MHSKLATTRPFSFAHTVAFVRRFPAVEHDFIVTDDTITAAVARGGRTTWFTLHGTADEVTLETPDDAPPGIAELAAGFIGARDDVAAFYAAAVGDRALRPILQALHGLHHVRFLTLAEIAVYCVMMQRNPITRAAAMKRAFVTRFGHPVAIGDRTLYAMPELAELVELDGEAIGKAIGHAGKGPMIATVVRGVAALGERFLIDAPYAEARDAMLEIAGIGPFSAAAILLRGLGRMDELPVMAMFRDVACAVYGDAFDEAAIVERYGRHIGYWSFYLKTGVPQMRRVMRPARAAA